MFSPRMGLTKGDLFGGNNATLALDRRSVLINQRDTRYSRASHRKSAIQIKFIIWSMYVVYRYRYTFYEKKKNKKIQLLHFLLRLHLSMCDKTDSCASECPYYQ